LLENKKTTEFRFQSFYVFVSIMVEATRVELVSKHILQKLSTCLFCFIVSGINWKQTTDQFLSCMSLLLPAQPMITASCFVCWLGGGAGNRTAFSLGHNDYL